MAPNLLTLFAEPSVALLYFMSVIALSCAALLMALSQRLRGPAEMAAARYTLAMGGVTVAWLLLMGGALVVLLSGQPASAILPPLDRAVNAAVLALVGWAFLVTDRESMQPRAATRMSETSRMVESPPPQFGQMGLNLLAVTVLLGVVAGYALTGVQWFNQFTPEAAFNTSPFGTIWTLGGLVLAAVILILIVLRFRHMVDAPLKMVYFILILAGYGYTAFSIANGTLGGSDSGALRLAFLAATPLLPVLVYRAVVERLTMAIHEKAAEATVSALTTISNNLQDTTVERESVTLLKAFGVMLEREHHEDLPRQIAMAAAGMLKADICALIVIDDPEYADVLAAYDAIQGRDIAAMAFKLDEQPTLAAAIGDKMQRVLYTDRNLNEIVDVYTRLDVQKIGPVYFQPLTREGVVNGVLIVALPYTQRDLKGGEKRLLESLAPVAARMLAIARTANRALLDARSGVVQAITEGERRPSEPSTGRLEMQQSLEVAREQINDLSAKVRELQIELDYERSRLTQLASNDPEGLSITQRMDKLASERMQLEQERERLVQALQEAQAQLFSHRGDDEELYKTAITLLTQERDDLYSHKEQLESELAAIRSQGESEAPAALKEMLTRLSDEKTRLSSERDQLRQSLEDVTEQLAAFGIEIGTVGMVTTLMSLTEERNRFKAESERAAYERDLLVGEVRKFQDRIIHEKQRDQKIASLENSLKRLAQDNEVLLKQRDTLSNAQGVNASERAEWDAARARLEKEMAALKADLDAAILDRNRVYAESNKNAEEKAVLLSERSKLMAVRTTLQTERDQLMARVQGNRELLEQLGADGIETLKKMIDDLTEERSELEHKLLHAQKTITGLREKVEQQMKRAAQRAAEDATPSALGEETAATLLSVAQELRTPLNAITAYVDLLINESVGILGELQQQFLQRVKANGDRLAAMIGDFVRVVAIDTGQLKLKFAPADMSEVIEDAITATRVQFREKGITLSLELPDQMPMLQGDRGALQQVMVELLSNAYRASPSEGEVRVKASVAHKFRFATRNGAEGEEDVFTDAVLIAVTDSGGGVSSDDLPRVFSRMHRADTALIKGLGDTGVGLSIVRALVESHQGRVWLESTLGESSTFNVVLPLQAQAEYAS